MSDVGANPKLPGAFNQRQLLLPWAVEAPGVMSGARNVNTFPPGTQGYPLVYDTTQPGNVGWATTPVVIPATSGTSLTVNGTLGQHTLFVNSGNAATTATSDLLIIRAGSTVNNANQGPSIVLSDSTGNTQSLIQQSGGQTEIYQNHAAGYVQAAFWNTNNGLQLNAPLAGVSLLVLGFNSGITLQVNSGTPGNNSVVDFQLNRAGSTANTVSQGPNIQLNDTTNTNSTILQNSGNQFEIWRDISAVNTQIAKSASTFQWSLYEPGFSVAALANAVTTTSGSFTGTLTGYASSLTGTVNWWRVGNFMILVIANASFTGTSNATTMTMTGLPAACTPTKAVLVGCAVENNTTYVWASAQIAASGTTITFGTTGSATTGGGFTASGTKGLPNGWTLIYQVS